jgi:uncharacterized repeat protein (TIGR03943 family)
VAVSPAAGGTTLVLVGVMLGRLAITGEHQRFVRTGMGPWLLLTGAAMIVLGLVPLIASLRSRPAAGADAHDGDAHDGDAHDGDAHDGDAHDHGPGGDRVTWLLLVPVAVLLLVTPPALGSFGVDRVTVSIGSGGRTFTSLAGPGPAPMTLLEVDQRAADRNGASIGAVPLRLTGFVAGDDGGGIRLARYQIACCAADAVAALVRLEGDVSPRPARDTWVSVTGVYTGVDAEGVPRVRVTDLHPVPTPVDPYE